MKLGLHVFIAGVLAAALLVPAAGAKPGNGNGNGNGNGPPAWAGGGGKEAKGGGKPEWAGKGQARKAENAVRQQERRAARAAVREGDERRPKPDNPASVCRAERELDADAFAESYGTNVNKANAFGKCVSQEAHERGGADGDEGTEEPGPGDAQPPVPGDESAAESGGSVDELTALQAFIRSLMQIVF